MSMWINWVCILCWLFNQLYCIHCLINLPTFVLVLTIPKLDLHSPLHLSLPKKTTCPQYEVTATPMINLEQFNFMGKPHYVRWQTWNQYTLTHIHTYIENVRKGVWERTNNCMRCVDWFFDFFKVKVKSIEIAVK